MFITKLELEYFRNYNFASTVFSSGLNVLYGKNASGKTNMLESIFLCSLFNSPRTTKDKDLVLTDKPYAKIKLCFEKQFSKHTILLLIDNLGKKKVLVDNIPILRSGDLLGVLGVVFFSPDEMKLVKESPIERRRFLDIALSQQYKAYFTALQRYNKTLKQKNNLLKSSYNQKNIDEMLDIWDIGLSKEGAYLIEERTNFLDKLSGFANEFHSKLSSNKEDLQLSYECQILSSEDTQKNLLENLRKNREKDKTLGYSSVGPHRDDIKISINEKDVRKFASQGQQRTVALSMKLAQTELYKNWVGEAPVLLLDDVLSELDIDRQKILLNLTKDKYQTFITCTEFDLPISANKILIDNGVIVK